MLLGELVGISEGVAATSARSAKVSSLAQLLRHLEPEEVEPAVAFLTGRPRHGKVGIGWAMLQAVDPPPAPTPSIEILELDAATGVLQGLAGPGSAARRHDLLGQLLGRATEAEADFIRRLLIGELRQGALEGVMTDAVARASGTSLAVVRRAAMLAGDLARVAAVALAGGETGLAAIGLDVLRPVLPMLASTAPDVASALGDLGTSSIEWKLDGARVQAHRLGGEVRLYTRNLNDVTARLPGVVDVVRGLDADSVVLDGEVLGVSDEGPEAFQETMSSFGRKTGPASRPEGRSGPPGRAALGVWFFDCLHLDGVDLLDRPLRDRADALDRIGAPRVPALVTDDLDAALAFQAEALAAGHEGVMVKAVRHGGQDLQGPHRCPARVADGRVPGPGVGSPRPCGRHRPAAGRRDRPRRRAVLDPLSRRGGPALRPGPPVPPRQGPGRRRRHRRAAGHAARRRRTLRGSSRQTHS